MLTKKYKKYNRYEQWLLKFEREFRELDNEIQEETEIERAVRTIFEGGV